MNGPGWLGQDGPMQKFSFDEVSILVVDDYPLVGATIRALLRSEGFRNVDVAHRGSQALEKMAQRDYAVVVCDLHMPGMSGLELARAVRNSEHAAARIILITAHQDGVPARSKDLADALLIKPLTSECLRQTIETLLSTSAVGERTAASGHASLSSAS
jgi:CheY-like chemotaxis protein